MSKQLSKPIQNKLSKLLENTGDMALKRRARLIIEEVNPKNGDNILEIGCGDGFYMHLLSNLGIKLKLTGVDIDDNALAAAKQNLKGKKVKLLLGDVMKKLPFESNTFDTVVMSEVCEHLPDDVKGLKEARRVLKKGGKLIVTVPNHNYPLFWDPVNWVLEHTTGKHIKEGFWAGLWNKHIRLYKPNEILKSVKKAGLKADYATSMTWWCIPFNHNLMYYAARKLHSGNMDEKTKKSINKYEVNSNDKAPLISYAFKVVNMVDSVNDLWQPKSSGVGVLVKATK